MDNSQPSLFVKETVKKKVVLQMFAVEGPALSRWCSFHVTSVLKQTQRVWPSQLPAFYSAHPAGQGWCCRSSPGESVRPL